MLDAKNELRSVVADGNTVFVEHRLLARLPNGNSYVNDYCFAYEVRDGQIAIIREYMDTRGGWIQVFGHSPPQRMLEFVAAAPP